MRTIDRYARMRDAVRELGTEGFVSAVLRAARVAGLTGPDRDLAHERRRHAPLARRSAVVDQRLEPRPAP